MQLVWRSLKTSSATLLTDTFCVMLCIICDMESSVPKDWNTKSLNGGLGQIKPSRGNILILKYSHS